MLRQLVAGEEWPHNWWKAENGHATRFLAFMLGWIITGLILLLLSLIAALYAYLCWVEPWALSSAVGVWVLARIAWQVTRV